MSKRVPQRRPEWSPPQAPQHLLIWPVLAMLGACTSTEEETDVIDVPEDTDDPIDVETGYPIPIDTAEQPEVNDEPAHWLNMYQDGRLNLSPSGGPYTNATGTLTVSEWLDVEQYDLDSGDTAYPWELDSLTENPILCEVEYSLIGAQATDSCSGCSFALDIEFNVIEGSPNLCRDPDLPDNGDVRRFGFHPGSETLQHDYQNTGNWFPWYTATQAGDTVNFTWTGRYGISVEEEEEQ